MIIKRKLYSKTSTKQRNREIRKRGGFFGSNDLFGEPDRLALREAEIKSGGFRYHRPSPSYLSEKSLKEYNRRLLQRRPGLKDLMMSKEETKRLLEYSAKGKILPLRFIK